MRILITGSAGFLGRNLISRLKDMDFNDILEIDKNSDEGMLKNYTKNCDFVYHFAAVHRPSNLDEFDIVNRVYFEKILGWLGENYNTCPVLLTSTIQALDDTAYGRSKLSAEELLIEHGKKNKSKVIIYRLKNIFGKWATPNHHSVVATFCYNIARNLPVVVNNPNHQMHMYYVDDVIDSFVSHLFLDIKPDKNGFYTLADSLVYSIKLQDLADTIYSFRENSIDINIKNMDCNLFKNLYITYLSYLPPESSDGDVVL